MVEDSRSRSVPTAPSQVPVIGAVDVVLPAFDDRLGEMARQAQVGDSAARDALYDVLEPKLQRIVSAVRPPYAPGGAVGVWDRDDVAQEGYLVFVELVLAWPGDVPFTAYILSRFPWRLRDTIRRGIARPSVPPRRVVVSIEHAERVADAAGPVSESSPLLEALLAELPPPLDTVLVAHALQGKTKTEIADAMGVNRRTVLRYWKEIERRVRAMLEVHPSRGRRNP